MTPYIDIHSHNLSGRDGVLSHPTISVNNDAIFSYKEPFWCGLHPAEVMSENDIISRLDAVYDKILGIGEIGLDRIYGSAEQINLFRLQLGYALERDKPITIHCVRMYNELIVELRAKRCDKIVIHSLVGSVEIAEELLALGCYLSFGGVSLKSPRTVEALRSVPIEKLFIESDSKGDIEEYYNSIASLLSLEINELKTKIYNNYLCLIG